MGILQRAAKLAKINPRAAYALVLGVSPAKVAETDPKTAYTMVTARGTPMGAWEGVEYFWPEPLEFDLIPERKDRFNDYYEVMYQYIGGDISLSVDMNAVPHIHSGGDKPGKFEARYHGQTEKGTWRDIKAIADVLRKLIGKAKTARKKAQDALKKLGGPKWDVMYDWGELAAEFKNPDRRSDATMVITFESVDDVIFGSEDKGEASINYAAGSDYEGAYGQREERRTYRSQDDMKGILTEAERLWKGWEKD